MARRRAAIAGGGLGFASGWNISNIGALADPLASAYGVSLVTVGLFTTVLFVVHAGIQVPAGRIVDRIGPARAGRLTIVALAVANAAALAAPDPSLALACRVLAGAGSGLAFVAGTDYIRASGGTSLAQGAFGSLGVAGSGCALAVVPQLDTALGWRAPFASALALALVVGIAVLAVPRLGGRPEARAGAPIGAILSSGRLWLLGALHAASFGASIVLANWIGTVLARQGMSVAAGAAAGAIMLVGVALGRLLGGWLARRRPAGVASLVARSLLLAGAAMGLMALGGPGPLAFALAAVAGLAAGIAFGPTISAAGRAQPAAPAAAVGLVNTLAGAAVVVATPLVGLTISLPGDGAIGFAAVGALTIAAALAVAPARLSGPWGGRPAAKSDP